MPRAQYECAYCNAPNTRASVGTQLHNQQRQRCVCTRGTHHAPHNGRGVKGVWLRSSSRHWSAGAEGSFTERQCGVRYLADPQTLEQSHNRQAARTIYNAINRLCLAPSCLNRQGCQRHYVRRQNLGLKERLASGWRRSFSTNYYNETDASCPIKEDHKKHQNMHLVLRIYVHMHPVRAIHHLAYLYFIYIISRRRKVTLKLF